MGHLHQGIVARLASGRVLPWPIAAMVLLALHVAAAAYLFRLEVNNAPEQYYAAGSSAIALRDALRKDFPSDEALTLLFRGGSLYHADTLKRVERLRIEIERAPLVDRVFTVTSQEQIRGTPDGFEISKLVDVEAAAKTTPQRTKERVLADRFAPGLLASHDGRYMAIAVRPKPLTSSLERQALRSSVERAIDAAGLRSLYVGDAGPLALDVQQLESLLADTVVFVPITVSIGILLLWWLVGTLRPVLFGVLAMSAVAAPAIALIPAAGLPYTMVAAILPSLLSAYAMATLMHFYAPVQRAQAAGMNNASSIAHAVRETFKPALLNVATTGAGLLSLLLVPIPPIQVFGAVGAAGTALVFVVVYLLLPPLMRRWDRKPWPQRASGMQRVGRLSSKLTGLSLRRPRTVLLTALLLVVVLVPLVRQVQVESNLLSYFAADHPANQVTRQVEARLAGVTMLEVSLRGAGRDSLLSVATLRAIRDLQDWLEQLPQVDRTLSMVDLVQEMHWAMNGEQAAFRAVPPDDRLLRQYLLIYDGTDLYDLVNRDFQHARVLVNLNTHGAHEIGAVIRLVRERLRTQPIPGIEVDIGGHGRLFSDLAEQLVEGQIKSFLGAFTQIFVIMAVMWRSVLAAGVCMVPNLAPLYFVFVLMGALGTPLDVATVMIAGLVLGITVDDTIHLYHGFRARLAAGSTPLFAIGRAFRVSGPAVLSISILLVSQFFLLSFSSFVPTANFGRLTAIGLLAGQAFELLLLPALLLWLARRGHLAARPTAGRGRGGAAIVAPDSWHERAQTHSRLTSRHGAAPGGSPALPSVRRLLVCRSGPCNAAGAGALWKHLAEEHGRQNLAITAPQLMFTRSSCLGPCRLAPVVQVYPEGVYYCAADTLVIDRVLDEHLLGGQVVEEMAYRPPAGPTS